MIGFSLRKEVDKSVILQGFSIPLRNQFVLQQQMKSPLQRGERMAISLMLEGHAYPAELVNQRFNEFNYPGHGNIVQVRYAPTSNIVRHLQAIFFKTYEFLLQQNAFEKDGIKRRVQIPISQKEYINFVMTDQPDVFLLDCMTIGQAGPVLEYYSALDEEAFEKDGLPLRDGPVDHLSAGLMAGFNDMTDAGAAISLKPGILRIRDYDRTIGDRLKAYYNHRCQICGNNFGQPYDTRIVEAHHIIPFTQTLNNNFDNQIIICPNHHRVIHRAKPRFDRRNLKFVYANGYIEPITLNDHLR